MRLKIPFGLDPFLLILLVDLATATLLPCRGQTAVFFSRFTVAVIALLFFLHGAKLSRDAIWAGIGHWRLHLLVAVSTFVLFPALGLTVRALGQGVLDPGMTAGILFLCLLPSTVQSSIAFTSIAGGNTPAAVCSATLSNVVGIFLTPVLVGLFMGARAKGGGVSIGSIEAIALQLLLPFIAGHLSRPLTLPLLNRVKPLVNLVDRGSILIVIYTAFSAAVVEGIWSKVSPGDIAMVLAICVALLAVVMGATTWAARAFGFSREDEIAIVFCGSKKSLASGVPMAGVLFPAAAVGAIIVPLMLFHQIQLMVCAVMARRYAASAPKVAGAEG
ncbi:MAG TPA: bile acid:sodium symporter family protein [Caulobacteraceae bacterium]|nr:bile acid:sodium symporter family protein [Caulobacteraceae bacterium]